MAGLGAVIKYNDNEDCIGCYSQKCYDNNVAEVASIAMALQYVKDSNILEECRDKTITIITDSSFALHRINYNPVGRDQFEQECLDTIHNFMKESKRKVNFLQVKGHVHSGGDKLTHYNCIADRIAGEYRLVGLELLNEPKRKRNKHLKNIVFNKKRKGFDR
jgi:ribonuclease HI